MKEVILAKSAGFCFGVKRAVDTVYEQAGKENVYTYGPIIHNEEVVKDLERKGVHVIEDISQQYWVSQYGKKIHFQKSLQLLPELYIRYYTSDH